MSNHKLTLQAELEQIIQDIIALGTDHSNNLPAPQNESDALQAILTTVSKHLPEKKPNNTTSDHMDSCELNMLDWYDNMSAPCTCPVLGFNTAITEMEKTLGGSNK